MRLKHNKIKNTGLLYEMLVKKMTSEITTSSIPTAVNIIKKYFHNTELSKEYRLYRDLTSTQGKSLNESNMILNEAISYYKKLDTAKIKDEKYKLVREVLSKYGEDFFNTQVENYALHASVFNIFEAQNPKKDYSIVDVSKNKTTILENLSKLDESREFLTEFNKLDKFTKKVAIKSSLEKLQKSLKENLNESQQELVIKYSTNTLNESYIGDYINSIKSTCMSKLQEIEDEQISSKLRSMLAEMSSVNALNINEEMMSKLLMYGELLNSDVYE